jgi:hypothetical protein
MAAVTWRGARIPSSQLPAHKIMPLTLIPPHPRTPLPSPAGLHRGPLRPQVRHEHAGPGAGRALGGEGAGRRREEVARISSPCRPHPLTVAAHAAPPDRPRAWQGKGTAVFYLELIADLLHLFVYSTFFAIVFMNYGLPLHLVGPHTPQPAARSPQPDRGPAESPKGSWRSLAARETHSPHPPCPRCLPCRRRCATCTPPSATSATACTTSCASAWCGAVAGRFSSCWLLYRTAESNATRRPHSPTRALSSAGASTRPAQQAAPGRAAKQRHAQPAP